MGERLRALFPRRASLSERKINTNIDNICSALANFNKGRNLLTDPAQIFNKSLGLKICESRATLLLLRRQIKRHRRPIRLTVRTSDSQSGNKSSILLSATKQRSPRLTRRVVGFCLLHPSREPKEAAHFQCYGKGCRGHKGAQWPLYVCLRRCKKRGGIVESHLDLVAFHFCTHCQ